MGDQVVKIGEAVLGRAVRSGEAGDLDPDAERWRAAPGVDALQWRHIQVIARDLYDNRKGQRKPAPTVGKAEQPV